MGANTGFGGQIVKMSVLVTALALPLVWVVTNAPPAQACTPRGAYECSSPSGRQFLAVARSIGIPGGSSEILGSSPLPNGKTTPIYARKFLDLSLEDSNIIGAGAQICFSLMNTPVNWDMIWNMLGVQPTPQQLTVLVDTAKSTMC